jgi:hypothetical protein
MGIWMLAHFATICRTRPTSHEGNPQFVHETLRFAIDTGSVERRDGAPRL